MPLAVQASPRDFSRALPVLAIAFSTLSVSSPVLAQLEAPERCFAQDAVRECLERFQSDVPGLSTAWTKLALEYLDRGDGESAADAFTKSGRPGADGLTIWSRHVATEARFEPVRSLRFRSRARSLLRHDSLDPGANLLLAFQDVSELVKRSGRLALPTGVEGHSLMVLGVAEPDPGNLGTEGGDLLAPVRYSARYRGLDVNVTQETGLAASRLFRSTVTRLRTVASDSAFAPYAVRELARAHLLVRDWIALSGDAGRLRSLRPDHPLGYLVGALAAQEEGRSEAAATLAEIGLDLLPEAGARSLLNPDRVSSPGAQAVSVRGAEGGLSRLLDWWGEQDPVVLTDHNERLAEHVARWIYADLRYGNPFDGLWGADTDPGRVVVRYGLPRTEAQFTGGAGACADAGCDRFAILGYGDMDFRFMDLGRRGTWSLFSPRANDYQGWRADSEIRSSDYVLLARQRFRDMPLRIDPTWEVADVTTLVFRSSTGAVDVYGIGLAPSNLNGAEHAMMVLDGRTRITSSQAPPLEYWRPGEVFIGYVRMPTLSLPIELAARVEAVAPATLEGPARTRVYRSNPEPVPPLDQLSLSSLVLATLVEDVDGPSRGATLDRRGLRIHPSVRQSFSPSQPIYAYFEVYGLSLEPSGQSDYEVTATLGSEDGRSVISRILGRGDNSVAAGFRSSGQERESGDYLVLETDGGLSGTYLLTLQITDRNTGETVERSTRVRFD